MNKCKVCLKKTQLYQEFNNNKNIFCGRVCQIKNYIGEGIFDEIITIKHKTIFWDIIRYLSYIDIIHNLNLITNERNITIVLKKIFKTEHQINKIFKKSREGLFNELLNLSLRFEYKRVLTKLLDLNLELKVDIHRLFKNPKLFNKELLKILLKDGKCFDANYIIGHACENGKTEIVRMLLDEYQYIDPGEYNNFAIRKASEKGYTEIVKMLLEDWRVDPTDLNNEPIRHASANGHTEIVKILLEDKRTNPSIYDNNAIQLAATNGHTEIVKILLQDKRVDPSTNDNFAIRGASQHGHVEIVKMLMKDKRVDPSDAILNASDGGHMEIVNILLKDKRVNKSKYDLAIRYASRKGFTDILKLLLK